MTLLFKHLSVKIFINFSLTFLFIWGHPLQLAAQQSDAYGAGLNGSTVAITGFWSVTGNPAGLASLQYTSFGMDYSNRFSMSQLSSKGLSVGFKTNLGTLGLNMRFFGYSAYNEIAAGIVYSKMLSKKLSVGIKLNYYRWSSGNDYEVNQNVSFDGGIQYELSSSLLVGFSFKNPMTFFNKKVKIQTVSSNLKLGLSYYFIPELMVTTEVEKNSFSTILIFRGGMEYVYKKMFSFRTGIGTGMEIFSIGLGYNIKHLETSFAATWHTTLGLSPQISLSYHL